MLHVSMPLRYRYRLTSALMSSMLVPSGSYLAMNVLAVEMLYVERSKRYANLLRKQVGVGPWD